MPSYFINPVFANVGPLAGLIMYVTMDQSGVPTDGQSGFAPLATVFNQVDGTQFVNDGDSSSSAWTAVPIGTSGAFVITKKITIASADILTLNATPVELIAAPGAGKAIQVISVMGRMNFLTAPYATNTDLQIIDTAGGGVLASDALILLGAVATLIATVPVNDASATAVTANGSVSAKVATGDPTAGSGTLDLYVSYKIVTL